MSGAHESHRMCWTGSKQEHCSYLWAVRRALHYEGMQAQYAPGAGDRQPGIRETARRLHIQAIVEAAEEQLATAGAAGLSLRAIARKLGMASSAIYRYFSGADALLTELIVRAYTDLGEAAEAAAVSVSGEEAKFMQACHACRAWALERPHRYALIYGSPVPSYAAPVMTVEPAARVGLLLLGIVARGVRGEGSAEYRNGGQPAQLMESDVIQRSAEAGLPPDLLPEAVNAWTHLFGMISFELFGHYNNVVADRRSYFDRMMRRHFLDLMAAGKSLAVAVPPTGPEEPSS